MKNNKLLSDEHQDTLSKQSGRDLIYRCTHNYADFHIRLLGRDIIDKVTGCVFPKVDFFWNKTQEDIKNLLTHSHTNYFIEHKK